MLRTNRQNDSGRKASDSAKVLLRQANRLVTQGRRRAAIDLLEEAVSDSPQDTSMLRALGRVYLLDHQPDKAVVYLRKALANSSSAPVQKDGYAPEAFTDTDEEYLEALAEDSSNDEFSPLDEPCTEIPEKEAHVKERHGTLHLKRRPDQRGDAQASGVSESQIPIIRKGPKKNTDPAPIGTPSGSCEGEPGQSGNPRSEVNADETRASDVLIPDAEPVDDTESDDSRALEPLENSDLLEDQLELAVEHDEELESVADSQGLPGTQTSGISIVDVEDDFDDDLDAIDPADETLESYPLDDFESEDFGWEDLDDFDEDASREIDDGDLTLAGIARGERARQVAVGVLDRAGWDRKYLPILETIFVESGWGAARVAIENQIEKGTSPEELVLARHVRSIWFGNEYLWTTFRMRSNASFMQAEAVYKNFSWADALRLIRCFPAIPDEWEVESFIEEVFEEWYFSNRLRRHFHAFLKYLHYRIGASRRALQGDLGFLFSLPLEAEWGVDNPELLREASEMRVELGELGADSGLRICKVDN